MARKGASHQYLVLALDEERCLLHAVATLLTGGKPVPVPVPNEREGMVVHSAQCTEQQQQQQFCVFGRREHKHVALDDRKTHVSWLDHYMAWSLYCQVNTLRGQYTAWSLYCLVTILLGHHTARSPYCQVKTLPGHYTVWSLYCLFTIPSDHYTARLIYC